MSLLLLHHLLFRQCCRRPRASLQTRTCHQVCDLSSITPEVTVERRWLTRSRASCLQAVLRTLEGALAGLHVPYSNGWAIIALTASVKLATFPFTKIQVRSDARMICRAAGGS